MHKSSEQKELLDETFGLLKIADKGQFNFDEAKGLTEELHRIISYHDYRYYIEADPVISDYEYDTLYKLLKKLEENYPELVTSDSPTQRISDGLNRDFPAVEHLVPMLSLDNSYNAEDLVDFDRKVREAAGAETAEYCVEPKFDGAGISIIYENNRFARGASRGDGVVGEDITPNLRVLRTIPLTAKFSSKKVHKIEIRGEVLINKKYFVKFNEQRIEQGLTALANPRNAAAGSLRMIDPKEVAKRGLEAFLYHVSFATDQNGNNLIGNTLTTHSGNIEMLAQLGFRTPEKLYKVCKGIQEVIEFCEEWEQKRDAFEYELDGLVVKVNKLELQEKLGFTSHHPRWAMAYKFKARQSTTTLLNVDFQVGRIGTVTPVAKLKPVPIGGVTVSSASMFNEEFIMEKDIRIGDKVLVERAGDVIPYIVRPLIEVRDGSEKKIVFPKNCPSCSAALVKTEEEVALRCVNIGCPAQVLERLKHFVSKDAMDITGLGAANVERFIKLGLISSIPDIYNLDYTKLEGLEKFGAKSIENLKQGIEASKKRPLNRLLFGLGIRYVGQTTAKTLAGAVECITDLSTWNEEKLIELPDVGPKVAASVADFFSHRENLDLLKQLEASGVQVCHPKDKPGEAKAKLQGLNFVFTGSLEKFTRGEAQQMVEEHGGNTASSVSSKTNYLVAGADAGSKLEKAKKLGVEIISEDDFLKMIS